jgi:hypothetical protein
MAPTTAGFAALRASFAADSAFSEAKDARTIDKTLSGVVVDTRDAHLRFGETFKLVLLVDGPGSASTVDTVFAYGHERLGGLPGFVFVFSCDESVVGRCAHVSRRGNVFLVAIADAHIDADAHALVRSVCMETFSGWVTTLASPVPVPAFFDDAIHAATEFGADRVVSELERDVQRYVQRYVSRSNRALEAERADGGGGRDGRDGGDSGEDGCELPDIAALLAEAQGPVARVTGHGYATTRAATIHGGRVAVVYTRDIAIVKEIYAHGTSARMPQVQAADIVVMLCAEKVSAPVLINRNRVQGRWRGSMICFGAPAAHVVHVIDEALAMFYERHWWQCVKGLQSLWFYPCDRKGEARLLAARVGRTRLTHAMARCVDANLETIKAKLWAPEGRLARRMMANEMSEGMVE